jgi:hypothetical protein
MIIRKELMDRQILGRKAGCLPFPEFRGGISWFKIAREARRKIPLRKFSPSCSPYFLIRVY